MAHLCEAVVVLARTRGSYVSTDVVRLELDSEEAERFLKWVRTFSGALNTERLRPDETD